MAKGDFFKTYDFSKEAATEQPPIPIPVPARPLKITPQVRFKFPVTTIPTATPPVPGPAITTTAPSNPPSHTADPIDTAFAAAFAEVDARDASTTSAANGSAQPGPDVSMSGAPPAPSAPAPQFQFPRTQGQPQPQPRNYTVQNFFQMKNAVPAVPRTQDENPFAAYLESLKTGASAKQNPFATPHPTNGISNSRNVFITSRQPASRSLPIPPPPTPSRNGGFQPMLGEQDYLLCLPAGTTIFLRCGVECCVTNGAQGMEWQESFAFRTVGEAVGYREVWPCRGCGERLVLDWWEIRKSRLRV